MARLKRYDLYDGDGEIIRDLDLEHDDGRRASSRLPGKQPLGRDEGLRERDAWDRHQEEQKSRRRYFRNNEEDDGLGAPSTVFDDLNRFEKDNDWEDSRPKYRRKQKSV